VPYAGPGTAFFGTLHQAHILHLVGSDSRSHWAREDIVNNRSLIVLMLLVVLLIGGYVVYENQQDDIEIELPDIDID
jgi:hypothetical protein